MRAGGPRTLFNIAHPVRICASSGAARKAKLGSAGDTEYHFFETRNASFISLCKTDCSPRISHLRDTPDQLLSVTVAWSLSSAPQRTRLPTLSFLDSSPVMAVMSP